MRLISFRHADQAGYGLVEGDTVLRLDGPGRPGDLKAFLATNSRDLPKPVSELPLASVELLPPIPNPGKVLCVATNFDEPGRDAPRPVFPIVFTRFAESQVGHGQALRKPPESDRYDFEGELAVVIGAGGHRIDRADAIGHVAGYSCFNDGTARDWQKHSSQFTPGKNFVGSGAFGPWLVTVDSLADPYDRTLVTRVNGREMQRIHLSRMIFDIAWLIAYFSTFTRLEPGDVLVTGTPSGFGSSRTPPEFRTSGDVIEVEIDGVGLLANTVIS